MSKPHDLPAGIKRANLILRRLRFAIYVMLIVLLGYSKWRYDLIRLPEGGISPLLAFNPGTRLVVDMQTSTVHEGDAVFYRLDDGTWLLGRLQAPPASAPKAVWEACEAGSYWIRKEREECPGQDSLILGPIAPENLVGRVCGTVPW
jgi:hypothetical protein